MQETASHADITRETAREIEPESFVPKSHFYPRVLHAQVHSAVGAFFRLRPSQIVSRYCHLNPKANPEALLTLLRTHTKYLNWCGIDLFYTVSEGGARRMVVIETNSCASGNKSMPLVSDDQEQGGYRRLLETCFLPMLKRRGLPQGKLAVVYDKNFIEASGYAATLADLTGESVLLASWPTGGGGAVSVKDDVLHVRDESNQLVPIRAAFRYVTQRPWDRVPARLRTALCNPIIGCLAGGRNKLIASKAYEFLNAQLGDTGLVIRTPETIRDVGYDEVPLWVERFGGYAVVKNPYSNAGQGVWTIAQEDDLKIFQQHQHSYDRFIVQGLIGNSSWTSTQEGSRYYHVGTMPSRKGEIYVADLRVAICSGPEGFAPVSAYARRARKPLTTNLETGTASWDMLGTNLSVAQGDGGWGADTDRLILMDRRDFNQLGMGPDDLIEAYIQSVLCAVAIDRMANRLINSKGQLKKRLFRSLNDDPKLIAEIVGSKDD